MAKTIDNQLTVKLTTLSRALQIHAVFYKLNRIGCKSNFRMVWRSTARKRNQIVLLLSVMFYFSLEFSDRIQSNKFIPAQRNIHVQFSKLFDELLQ